MTLLLPSQVPSRQVRRAGRRRHGRGGVPAALYRSEGGVRGGEGGGGDGGEAGKGRADGGGADGAKSGEAGARGGEEGEESREEEVEVGRWKEEGEGEGERALTADGIANPLVGQPDRFVIVTTQNTKQYRIQQHEH